MAHDALDEDLPEDGWDAISMAAEGLYGAQKPLHYGTQQSFHLGGSDPLDGISVYKSDNSVPHWHFISFGLTELYEKESRDLEHSGWGFEFTFRLKRDAGEEPPAWVLSFLQNLARYVFTTKKPFDVGHRMGANGPIALNTGTELGAVTFILDPELGEMDTPHGHMKFLQIVAITEAELAAMRVTSTEGVLEILAIANPLFITDLERTSVVKL